MNFDKEEIFHTGEEFCGYIVERLLGNGSLGGVYLVRNPKTHRRHALKVLFPDVAKENPTYVKRFLREARIAMRVRHPNLVAVTECGHDEASGLYYLVMDYVMGGDLRQAIAFAGRFDPTRAVEIIMQVASALEEAWKSHVVHRDIKPENIMVQTDGLVKLVDLGIAKSEDLKDTLNTRTEAVFGTPSYIAPEQALDASAVDTRADIFSLGVVLFEMIAGHPPYDGANAPQIIAQTLSGDPFPDIRDYVPSVDPLLATLIRRMCVKEKERRIPNPTALLKEFNRLGYYLKRPTERKMEFAASADTAPTLRSMKEILESLPAPDTTMARHKEVFATHDIEIQSFIRKLRLKSALRWLAWAIPAVILAAMLVDLFF